MLCLLQLAQVNCPWETDSVEIKGATVTRVQEDNEKNSMFTTWHNRGKPGI